MLVRTASWFAAARRAVVAFSLAVAPRAVIPWLSNLSATADLAVSSRRSAAFGFPRSLRLIKTSDYGVLVHVRNEHSFRLATQHFSVNALSLPDFPGRLRVGITVGKRNAHRSVDRALVKRILREAARKQAPSLIASLREAGLGLDVSLRLRSPLAAVPGHAIGVRALKATLGEDAASLMALLDRRTKRIRAKAKVQVD